MVASPEGIDAGGSLAVLDGHRDLVSEPSGQRAVELLDALIDVAASNGEAPLPDVEVQLGLAFADLSDLDVQELVGLAGRDLVLGDDDAGFAVRVLDLVSVETVYHLQRRGVDLVRRRVDDECHFLG